MPGFILSSPKAFFTDAAGNPLASGQVQVYLAGTTTPSNTWQDRAQLSLNTNPIVLDARGSATVWLAPGIIYDLVVSNSLGAVQYTIEDVLGVGYYEGTAAGTVNFLQGTDIAGAATVNLTTATGNRVRITGSGWNISAVTLTNGPRQVYFVSTGTITHSASLVLPGAANITVAAGDVAEFDVFNGVVYCTSYQRASGLPVVNGASLIFLSAGTVSAAASLDLVSTVTATYDGYLIKIQDFVPAVASPLRLRTSSNAGVSFDTAAADYNGTRIVSTTGVPGPTATSATNDHIPLHTNNTSTTAAHGGVTGNIWVHNMNSAGFKAFTGEILNGTGATAMELSLFSGQRLSATAVNAFRLYFSGGNIASGTYQIYGVRKA